MVSKNDMDLHFIIFTSRIKVIYSIVGFVTFVFCYKEHIKRFIIIIANLKKIYC